MNNENISFHVVINGAGPVGCLAALLLQPYCTEITLIEKRCDLRLPAVNGLGNRSINLVLTSRGLYALEKVGLKQRALEITVPVEGRLIHATSNKASTAVSEEPILQRYGLNEKEVNYSISRNELNKMLLTECEERNVKVIFDHELMDINLNAMTATYKSFCKSETSDDHSPKVKVLRITADLFIGADGIGSITRRAMLHMYQPQQHCHQDSNSNNNEGENKTLERIQQLGVSYKEITFPGREVDKRYPCESIKYKTVQTEETNKIDSMNKEIVSQKKQRKQKDETESTALTYSMNCKGLHIWPHGVHFLMALADVGNTFTGTMYLPNHLAELPKSEEDELTLQSDLHEFNEYEPHKANKQHSELLQELPTFAELEESAERIREHVRKYYPDLPFYVPDYVHQMQTHTASPLATLFCTHWHWQHKVVLIGDAAHAITPFFGQGMNLGFETAMLLERFMHNAGLQHTSAQSHGKLNTCNYNERCAALQHAFTEFEQYHQPSANAIANMAIENFVEMAYKTSLPHFHALRELEKWIERNYTSKYRSRYYMITETLLPYKVAQEAGPYLDKCLRILMKLYLQRTGHMQKMHKTDTLSPSLLQSAQLITQPFEDVLTKDEVLSAIDSFVSPFIIKHGICLENPLYDGYYPIRHAEHLQQEQ